MRLKYLTNGLIKENPTFIQLIGMCPVLAITTSLQNGIGMGLAVTAVLMLSNMMISAIRRVVPGEIRIPIFVIVIATFVTIVSMVLEAFVQPLYKALGIFLPLIVVNCIILARAEAFAFDHGIFDSMLDGIGMGLGFTGALCIISSIREFLATGGIHVAGVGFQTALPPTTSFILPPGAFLTLGLIIAVINHLKNKKEA
ncbi:electron transport complex subunit RsxE [Guggenheimella bovis]